jgi:hypothetical protein
MIEKPALTFSFCVRAVVNSAPFPGRFETGTAATTTLFDLGKVDLDHVLCHHSHKLSRHPSNAYSRSG